MHARFCIIDNAGLPWLLVFDNIDYDPEDNITQEYWPNSQTGSVLVTARHESALGQFTGEIYPLGNLNDNEGADLLLKLAKKPSNQTNLDYAKNICSRVSCFPLAISSVAHVVVSRRFTLQEYWDEHNNFDLIEKSNPLSGPEARYSFKLQTVFLSQVSALETDANSLLNILAFLDPSGIEEQYLFKGLVKGSPVHILKRSRDFAEARDALCMNGLISRNEELKLVWMHRMLQEFCRFRSRREGHQQQIFEQASSLVSSIWPVPERHNRHNRELWKIQEQLINHILSLAMHYMNSLRFDHEKNGQLARLEASLSLAELFYNGAW